MVKAIACCGLLVLVAAGCAGSHSESVGSVRISGGSAPQRRLLASIVEGMGPTGIATLTFGTSRDGQPLLSAEYTDEHDAHAEWTSSLAAAAFDEEARRGGARRVEVFRNGVLGSVNPIRGGDGATVPKPDLPAVRRELETVVGRQGGRVVDLRVFAVAGRPAASVVVKTNGAAEYAAERAPVIEAALTRDDMAGSYLEVRDAKDVAALRTYDADFAGLSYWATGSAPPYEGCGPDHSYPAGAAPPPCPFRGPRVLATAGVVPRLTAPAIRRIADVKHPTVVGVGREGDIEAYCQDAGVDTCLGVPANKLAWVVAGPSGWAVVDDATGTVLGSG